MEEEIRRAYRDLERPVSSSPGMRGVVMTVSLSVGEAIFTWCAVSLSGDQTENAERFQSSTASFLAPVCNR